MVTGGASGLGYAFSESMAEAGADVVIADIDEGGAEEAAETLSDDTGAEVISVKADVTDKEDADVMVEEAVDRLGRLDVAFANAGIAELEGQVSNYTEDQWQRIIDVNLTGVFYTDRAAAEVMLEQGSGSIINTASVYGLVASDILGTMFAYATSKGGVVNMTRALGAELAEDGVRVNAIAPSHVRTGLAGGFLQEDQESMKPIQEQIEEDTPMAEIATPDDYKGIALLLASDASRYCTGYTYAVDGGWLSL